MCGRCVCVRVVDECGVVSGNEPCVCVCICVGVCVCVWSMNTVMIRLICPFFPLNGVCVCVCACVCVVGQCGVDSINEPCVCVCMCVCICVCMCVYVYLHVYVCVCVCCR